MLFQLVDEQLLRIGYLVPFHLINTYRANVYYYVLDTVLEVGDDMGTKHNPCSPETYIMGVRS